jgi:hypothetical protein
VRTITRMSGALMLAIVPVAAIAQAPLPPAMGFGASLSADTVKVGDRFKLKVTVRVPKDAVIAWPEPADSAGPIAMRAPVRVNRSESGSVPAPVGAGTAAPMRTETAEYALVAWAIGSVPVKLPDIKVTENGTETLIPLNGPPIFVASVLPGDTSLRVPKPAKALFPRIVPWWEVWWPALVVLALLAVLAYVVYRYRHRTKTRLELDPFARASRDFQRLDRLALHEAGEQGRFVALALEVLRTYLSVRIANATLALTSDELLTALAADSRVPTQRLAPLLAEADAIKFGRGTVSALEAKEFALEARGVVSAVEQAEQARQAAARAARKAENKQQRVQRQQAEDDARQKSRQQTSEVV